MDITPLDQREESRYGMNHFIVTGSYLKQRNSPPQTITSNFNLGIACKTIDDAIRLTRKKYPEAIIRNVTHQGPLEVMENS